MSDQINLFLKKTPLAYFRLGNWYTTIEVCYIPKIVFGKLLCDEQYYLIVCMSEQKYNLLDCNTSFQVIWYCVGNWTNKLIATYQRRVGTLDLPSIYQLAQN